MIQLLIKMILKCFKFLRKRYAPKYYYHFSPLPNPCNILNTLVVFYLLVEHMAAAVLYYTMLCIHCELQVSKRSSFK